MINNQEVLPCQNITTIPKAVPAAMTITNMTVRKAAPVVITMTITINMGKTVAAAIPMNIIMTAGKNPAPAATMTTMTIMNTMDPVESRRSICWKTLAVPTAQHGWKSRSEACRGFRTRPLPLPQSCCV